MMRNGQNESSPNRPRKHEDDATGSTDMGWNAMLVVMKRRNKTKNGDYKMRRNEDLASARSTSNVLTTDTQLQGRRAMGGPHGPSTN